MITNMIRVYVLISFYDENGLHKAGSVTLVKEEDFNPLYMKAIPAPPTVDAYTKEETNDLLNTKQDTLTAGTGITISNNVISATGGSGKTIQVRSGAINVFPPSTATYNFPTNQAFDTSDPDNTVFVLDLKVNGDDHLLIEKSRTSTHIVFEVDPACMYKNTTSNGVFKETGTVTLYFKLSDGKHDASLATVSMADEFGIVPNDATGTLVTDLTSISFGGKYYTIPSGGGGGGGSSLVVTLTGAYAGATIDLASMAPNSNITVNADVSYANIKAADDIIFKIVDTTQAGNKYTLKPTGMCTLNVAADQSLFFTFSVITPSSSTPKVFKLDVGPWSNAYTLLCVA